MTSVVPMQIVRESVFVRYHEPKAALTLPSPRGRGESAAKAGGTTRRPFVLQMDRGVFYSLESVSLLTAKHTEVQPC